MEGDVVFHVVVVGPHHGAGQEIAASASIDKEVRYSGDLVTATVK